jgi:hypothetical protein
MTEEQKLKFILSNRLAKQLVINNYIYYKNNENDGKYYWQVFIKFYDKLNEKN